MKWGGGFLLLVLAVLSLLIPLAGSYYTIIAITICLNIILASSIRLCLTTGLFNVAAAAFMGIGAYTSTLLVMKAGMPFEVGLLAGGVLAAAVSILIGYPAIRLTRGLYFALVTMAFVEVVKTGLLMWQSLTGGPRGLPRIPYLTILGVELTSKTSQYYLALFLVVLTLVVLYRLERSRFGTIWKAIGQSEDLAQSLGVNLVAYKILAFVISSFFVALAGAYYAHYVTYISPHTFGFMFSLYALLYVWVGGRAYFVGPIAGAIFMTLLFEPFRGLPRHGTIFFAVALLLTIIFLPGGIVTLRGKVASVVRRVARRARQLKVGA